MLFKSKINILGLQIESGTKEIHMFQLSIVILVA